MAEKKEKKDKEKKEAKEEEKGEEKEEVKVSGIFSGFGKMISSLLNLTGKMLEKGEEVAERKGEVEGKIGGKPAKVSYGYKVRLGLRPGVKREGVERGEEEYKPHIIKKIRKAEEKIGEKIEGWKPILDIFDKLKEIKVVAELPKGTKKKDIKIKVEGNRLKIITPKYSREAQLPCSVGSWNFKLYKTVLEIRLQKKKGEKKKAKK